MSHSESARPCAACWRRVLALGVALLAAAPAVAQKQPLWASPTDGEAIDALLVPDGSDLVVWLRPRRLLASEEGRRAWRALGPAGERARERIASATGGPLDEIERLVVGVTSGGSYDEVDTRVVAEPTEGEDWPLLQLEIEQLLESADEDRVLTLVFSPRFLMGGGGSLVEGPWAPLRGVLLDQVRDAWKAISLSIHLSEDPAGGCYWELRLLGDASTPASQSANRLAELAAAWPEALEAAVTEAQPTAHSAALLAALPAMARVVADRARSGAEGRQAVMNGWLPRSAAHNLVLAAELLVAETASIGGKPAVVAASDDSSTLADRLLSPVTIRFDRESLETAVAILSETLSTPITIVGRDLQLEGITRNQMLSLDVQQSPAGEALVEVLRRANPDPLAKGPADQRQKLVYVAREGGLVITTRAAAESRKETLPKVFRTAE